MADKIINLVCSSGGVKCFSYIGAYKKLLENDYTIQSVSASSMGSIIGILISSGTPISDMEKAVLEFPMNKFFRKRHYLSFFSHLRYPFSKYHKPDYRSILLEIIGKDPRLGDLKIPFGTVAIDLRQGELLTYSSDTHPEMYCSEVLRIATAIPPIFEPYRDEGTTRLLVDGGIGSGSPAWLSSAYPGNKPIVILKSARPADENYKVNLKGFIYNMVNAASSSNDKFILDHLENAVIVEINVGDQKAVDFKITPSKIEKFILQGYTAMGKTINQYNDNFYSGLNVQNIYPDSLPEKQAERANITSKRLMDSYYSNLNKRNLVFISYSSKDIKWLEKFKTFFRPLEQFHDIKVWDDSKISTGARWEKEIDRAMSSTKVAICLVTPAFLASEYITERQIEYFYRASENQKVPIFFVAVSSTL